MTDITANRQLRKPTAGDAVLLVFIGCVWGSSFLPIKIAVPETGPVLLVFLRTLTALVPLWLYMAWRGIPFPNNRFDMVLIALMSLLNSVIPFFLLSWAGLHVTSGVMALIMGTGPLLALFASHYTTRDDKLNLRKFLGMLIGLCGLMVVIGEDAMGGLTENLLGDLAVLGAIGCYVCATAMVRKVRSTRIEAIATTNMLVSVIVLAPIMFLTQQPAISALSTDTLLAVLYLGIITTGIGYVLRYHMVLSVGQSFTSMASYIMPIVGVILGVLFLAEPLSTNILIALALVLAGFGVARLGA